jgi:uncharacterized phage-associated protein
MKSSNQSVANTKALKGMERYDSTILAKYITAYFNDKRIDINMTKIQKLMYIAYGIFLAVKGERLVDEHPQAWPYGPVFPTTRRDLLKSDLNAISLHDDELKGIAADETVCSLIGLVYDTFGNWTASQLSEWSHKEGSPWEKTVSGPGFKWGNCIKDDYIESYFKKIIVSTDDQN